MEDNTKPPRLLNQGEHVVDLEGLVRKPSPAAQPLTYETVTGEVHGFNLRDYWRVVRNHLWLILAVTLILTCFITIWAALKPDYYEAYARVQVDLESKTPAVDSSKDYTFILSADPTYFNTQLQFLTSPRLLRRVVKTLDLEHNARYLRHMSKGGRKLRMLMRMFYLGKKDEDVDTEFPSDQVLLTNALSPSVSQNDLDEAKRLEPLVKDLQARLTVEPVRETRGSSKETRLIDIRLRHPSPQLASKIVNAICDAFVLSNLEEKASTGNVAGDFLKKRVAELQAEIRRGEEQLLNYAKYHQIISLDPGQNIVVERLTGLNKQLLEAENDRKLAEANYRTAAAPNASRALAEESAKQIAEAEVKLADLRQRRAQLLVRNTQQWPEVKEVNQQIQVLENQIKETRAHAVSVVLTNLETRYRQSLAREESLRADFNRQRALTQSQNEAAITYRIIQQEISTNKTLLNNLLQSFKENDVVLAGATNNIHVVDYALMANSGEPDGPLRLVYVMLGSALSLFFALGLAFFLEYRDDTLRSIEDVENKLQLPALGTIPAVKEGVGRRLSALVSKIPFQKNGSGHPELMLNGDPQQPLAEVYRRLRTSVLLSLPDHTRKRLLVTSSIAGEGKTTTAINISISLAQIKSRVLLIDANMHRPRVQSIFGLEQEGGLSTILAGNLSAAEILGMTVRHGPTNLELLPAGQVPPNPTELLYSGQFARLLEILQSTYDYIIIDSPSVTSSSDSVIISTNVDSVLMVIHGGKSPREIVQHSLRVLSDAGTQILGVVLNNVRLRSYGTHQHYYLYPAKRQGQIRE